MGLAPPFALSCKGWTSQGSAGEVTLVVKTGNSWQTADQPCSNQRPITRDMCCTQHPLHLWSAGALGGSGSICPLGPGLWDFHHTGKQQNVQEECQWGLRSGALHQTNDSLQWLHACKNGWIKEITVWLTVSHCSFQDEIFFLYWFFLYFILFYSGEEERWVGPEGMRQRINKRKYKKDSKSMKVYEYILFVY